MGLKTIQRIYPKRILKAKIKCLIELIFIVAAFQIYKVNAQDLVLQDMTITTTETFSASKSITAGPNFTITGSGDVIMGAPVVTLRSPFSLIEGGKLRVVSHEIAVNIKTENPAIPNKFVVHQNYPNPFNPTTRIKFAIPLSPVNTSAYRGEEARENIVTLKVYDIFGREVAVLVNEKKSPGTYEVEFAAGNLASGVYFYRLVVYHANDMAGFFIDTKKMILLK